MELKTYQLLYTAVIQFHAVFMFKQAVKYSKQAPASVVMNPKMLQLCLVLPNMFLTVCSGLALLGIFTASTPVCWAIGTLI